MSYAIIIINIIIIDMIIISSSSIIIIIIISSSSSSSMTIIVIIIIIIIMCARQVPQPDPSLAGGLAKLAAEGSSFASHACIYIYIYEHTSYVMLCYITSHFITLLHMMLCYVVLLNLSCSLVRPQQLSLWLLGVIVIVVVTDVGVIMLSV